MPEKRRAHPTYAGDAIVNVETRHEESDVNVRALLWFVVLFIVFSVAVHALLWLLYRFFVQIGRGSAANAPQTAVARPVDANVPPQPRLQPFPTKNGEGVEVSPTANTPEADMRRMQQSEEHALRTHGWVDRQRGVVRIPIEDAKRQILKTQAFPVVQAPAAASTTGVTGSAAGVTPPAGTTSPAATRPAASPAHTTTPPAAAARRAQ